MVSDMCVISNKKFYLTSRASAIIAEATGHAALVPSNSVVQASLGSAVLYRS